MFLYIALVDMVPELNETVDQVSSRVISKDSISHMNGGKKDQPFFPAAQTLDCRQ